MPELNDRELVRRYLADRYGFGAELDDQALKRAQDEASQRRREATIGEASALIGGGIAGVSLDRSPYERMRAEAEQPVQDLLQRRSASGQELDFRTKRADQDPNDPENAAFREYLKARRPELRDVPGFDGFTIGRGGKLIGELEKGFAANEVKKKIADAAIQGKVAKIARPSDKQTSALDDFDAAISGGTQLLEQFDPNYVGLLAPLASTTLGKQVSDPNKVAYHSKIGRLTDTYRRLVTGAAAADKELARIESRLPQVNDPPKVFQEKARTYIQEMNAAKARYLRNLERQGKNVESFNTPTATPIGLSGDKVKRLAELRAKKAAGTLGR